ncbi:hypothetical protein [Streptomyces cadmiisoli]|uniref:hypothetical protein n=1 Tax=Streptomyces cadmiisoli TaxID=2184053 RepID=UPI003D736CD6
MACSATLGFRSRPRACSGLVSTHRDGWRISVADLARRSRDGEAAVRSGLNELEKRGPLCRERERHRDGTLGAAAYVITDLPSQRICRSQPMSGFPPVDDPTSADHLTKNTIRENTTKQKTKPLRPCHRSDTTRPAAKQQPEPAASPSPGLRADAMHPGIRLLLDIGARRPDLLLTGKVLTERGRVITAMMEAGWNTERIRHVITHRPIPDRVRTTVGAIIAAGLRAAQADPPPAIADSRHHDGDVREDEATAWPLPSGRPRRPYPALWSQPWPTGRWWSAPAMARPEPQPGSTSARLACAGCCAEPTRTHTTAGTPRQRRPVPHLRHRIRRLLGSRRFMTTQPRRSTGLPIG